MSAEEFDFLSRHPGGFDREFYTTVLVGFLDAYLQEHSLQLEEVQVLVQLESGVELRTIGAVPALTWVSFQTEDDETWFAPITPVRRISFKRRPGEPCRTGFTVQTQAGQAAPSLAS